MVETRFASHTWISAVFGKASIHGYTVSLKVLAEKDFSPSAVEALAAEFGVVSHNSVANGETIDLGANSCNDADSFMTFA